MHGFQSDAGGCGGADGPPVPFDNAAEANKAQLDKLGREIGRIAAALARMSADVPPIEQSLRDADAEALPPLSAGSVRSIIRSRRLRARFFADTLFADPAWDMMLDLLHAEIAQLRLPVSSLCLGAAVPTTTALRWINKMVDEGLFKRRRDRFDGRRIFIELAPEASRSLRQYFAELGHAPATI